MVRTVKLRVRVNHEVYFALEEVVKEYGGILEDALEYGLRSGVNSFVRLKAGIYGAERERHGGLPSHYIYTACEDVSMRLKSFLRLRRLGRAYTDRPELRSVTVHLDDHLWRFGLDAIQVATKRGWVGLEPQYHRLFWMYLNGGWGLASEARFKLLKGNVVEIYLVFKKGEPEPYEPKGFLPIDLNEDSVSTIVDGAPVLLETNNRKITLGYHYRRLAITRGKSTGDRDVRGRLRMLKERDRKLDARRKLAKLIVMEALRTRSAIVLENLPKRAPEHMVKGIRDKQLRLRIYHSAFSSMKRQIIEETREYGVPVILVNPSHTSSLCPIHGARINYRPNGSNAPRVGKCPVGGELWHRDVAALYNLLRKAGDGRPMPLASTGPHDPHVIKMNVRPRAKSLHSIMSKMKVQGQTVSEA
ncbi:RNA-guided endonuclease InsQ/TnpB family protein [Caldivirga sp.]|uniref:RNA-guided endonuclease InsQ/TnpB family protein n=1 Tax=Caldivirga sp. TaxID=2080243 RepID=UPI003D0CE88C